MDNITHTLIGVGIARAGLSQRLGRGTTWVLALASNLTDIDVFWGFVHSGESFEYRRMLTHSVFGMPLVAALSALVFSKIFKNQPWKTWFGLCLLGMAVHVLFDLLNSYGVVLLYPVSRTRFELGWLFIVDLMLIGLLVLPLAIRKIRPLWSVIAVALYVCVCGVSHWSAGRFLKSWAQQENKHPSFRYVLPEAFGPHRFRGVLREGNHYDMLLINTLTRSVLEIRTFQTEEDSPEVQKILTTHRAQQMMWFAKAPVWTRDAATGQWNIFDLRFVSMLLGRGVPFVYRFRVDGDNVEFLGR